MKIRGVELLCAALLVGGGSVRAGIEGTPAGKPVHLVVDARPGNPCGGHVSLQAAIHAAADEPVDAEKIIHLVSGTRFSGSQYLVAGIRNLRIVTDVHDEEGSCNGSAGLPLPPPAVISGAGLSGQRTFVVVSGELASDIRIENVDFVGNVGGGAMGITDSNVTLQNVAFRDNAVRAAKDDTAGGGAIAVRAVLGDAAVEFDGLVRFERNGASRKNHDGSHGAIGGAVYCAGGATVRSLPQSLGEVAAIFGDGSDRGGNFADGYGGAIGATSCGIELDDTRFFFNFAEQAGGAIYLHDSQALAFDINESLFFENRQVSEGIGGGAIAIASDSMSPSGRVDVRSSTFIQNRAEGVDGGGAIHLDALAFGSHSTRIEVLNTSFERNIALASGGALYVDANHGVPVELHIACTTPSLSRELPPDRYCMQFVENLAGHDGAAIRFLGRHAQGSSITSAAFLRNELVPIDPAAEGGSALSFAVDGAASVLELQQLLIDGERLPGAIGDLLGAAIVYDLADSSSGGSIRVRRSTIRYPGRVVRTGADSEWENTLVIGDDLTDIPAPGPGFSCGLAINDEAFPGLDLEVTPRGQLRPMESSILRRHGPELFAPCNLAQRTAGLPQADLDGMPRPGEADIDTDPPDIGVFERFRDGIFNHGFESAFR